MDSVQVPVGLADIFPVEVILVGLQHTTKQEVLDELLGHLVALGRLDHKDKQAVLQGMLAREEQGSTALGNGIALPHCRTSVTERFLGVLGLSPCGVDFDAVDGELVHSIFLVLAPLAAREQHYEVLGRIAAIGRDKGHLYQLRGCRTADAVHQFLRDLDAQ
jgi:PTS system fructose-specific IIC component